MSSPTTDEGKSIRPKGFQDKREDNKTWRKPFQSGFRGDRNGGQNWRRNDRGYNGKDQFRNFPLSAHKKKGKGKKGPTQNKVEVLKKKEEYSHLVNSDKLTVFDWDSTIVLRNLPAQIDAVKKFVQRELKDIPINKFCPIKKTFKNNALVTLACVLTNKADVDKAVMKLRNLKVGDYHVVVSRFLKPHSFISNAFSVCILDFPVDATEKHLSDILMGCGVLSSLDVQYSECGTVKKVLVNLSSSADLASLLQKDGTHLKSIPIQVIPLKPSTSIIVGNVHPKAPKTALYKVFGESALLVQKMSNMLFQIFFKDEKSAEKALSKNGEAVKDSIISVRPWSKENSKQHKVFVHLTGNQDQKNSSLDLNEFFQDCGKLSSITPIKKGATFIVIFESKEAQKAALQLNGTVISGQTVEVSKKPPVAKKPELKSTERDSSNNSAGLKSSSNKKNHVYFD